MAGALVRRYLEKQGFDVVHYGNIADSTRPPAALLHPFPGRSMELTEDILQAYEVASALARDVNARQVVVERPAPPNSREQKSYLRCESNYPEWLKHSLDNDTLRYSPAWVFDLSTSLKHETIEGVVERVEVEERPRLIHPHGSVYSAVVLCPGTEVVDWWQLSATSFGGEMVLCDEPHAEDRVVAGALHQLPCKDGRLALGHTFIAPGVVRPDQTVVDEYSTRFGQGLDGEVWRGQRSVYSDRQPVCGVIAKNVYILGALGARGLLLGPMLAELLARTIAGDDVEIPKAYDVRRASGLPGNRLIVDPRFLA